MTRERLRTALLVAAALAAAACNHDLPARPLRAGIVVSTAALQIPEGGSAAFDVTLLSAPTDPVDVEIRSGEPSLGLVLPPGYAVPAEARELTFTPEDWDVPRRVAIHGVRDRAFRPNAAYDVTLRVVQSGDDEYAAAQPVAVHVTMPDDDAPGFTLSSHELVTSEPGTRASFTVRLDAQPAGAYMIELAVAGVDWTEGTLPGLGGYQDPETLVTRQFVYFEPSDWAVPKTVMVQGVDDGIADGDRSYTITVGPPVYWQDYSTSPIGRDAWEAVASQQVVVTNREWASDEGTALAPVEVARSETRHAQVGTGVSHYVVHGTTGSVVITLLEVTGDVALAVDADGDFSAGVLCTSDAPGSQATERCEVAAPPDGTLHIRVSGTSTVRGAAFVLGVDSWLVSADVPKTIPRSDYPRVPVASSLVVTDGPWSIDQVLVRVDVAMPADADVEMHLVSPAGTRVQLTGTFGGDSGSFTGTVFDDAAPHISQGTSPYTGTFRPGGSGLITDPFCDAPLSALRGENARGTWYLEAGSYEANGTIVGWALKLR